MYMEASSPHQPGDDAKLYSPALKFFGIMCLEFYYYMSGAATGSLNVTINETVVFSASGDKGDIWHKASIDISAIVGLHWVSHQNRLKTVFSKRSRKPVILSGIRQESLQPFENF